MDVIEGRVRSIDVGELSTEGPLPVINQSRRLPLRLFLSVCLTNAKHTWFIHSSILWAARYIDMFSNNTPMGSAGVDGWIYWNFVSVRGIP